MRKPAFSICEIKGSDQLRGNHAADQCLHFNYLVQSLYFLNPKFQASYYLLWLYCPVPIGSGRESWTGFLATRPISLTYSPKGSSDLTASVRMTFIFTCESKVTEIVQSHTRIIGRHKNLKYIQPLCYLSPKI